MRVIAIRTDTVGSVELTEEQEIVTDNEELKYILLSWGWAKPYDDSKPLPPKGLGLYEPGIVYPFGRFFIKDGNLYQSKQTTSNTWVASEWDLLIEGL